MNFILIAMSARLIVSACIEANSLPALFYFYTAEERHKALYLRTPSRRRRAKMAETGEQSLIGLYLNIFKMI